MKQVAFVLVLLLAFQVCDAQTKAKKKFKGYEQLENGSFLKYHTHGKSTAVVDTGGAIFLRLLFLTEDSVFIDINKESVAPSYPMRWDAPTYRGDFLDIMSKLHVGDSVTFFMSLDSLHKYYPDEFVFDPDHDTMKYLGMALRVDSMYSKVLVDTLQARAARKIEENVAIMEKIMAVMGPIQLAADSAVPKLIGQDSVLLVNYLRANNYNASPDADGIYYRQLVKGTGDTIGFSGYVGVRYVGRYLDGTLFDTNTLVEGQEPMYYKQGTDPMIPGWIVGVSRMRLGGKAIFIIPGPLGYNDGLTRIFEVEIVSLKK